MRYDDFRRSDDIEDRRDDSGGGGGGGFGLPMGGGGLGIGTIIVLGLIGYAFGIDPRILIGGAEILTGGGQAPSYQTDRPSSQAKRGAPTDEMRTRFTQVLRGHIAIARAVFPEGISGAQLDTLARQYLWQAGVDFDHGTGHGVGSYLSVHEGPARISKLGAAPLKRGMILSNEPGYYKEGAYGIRIENLVLVEQREIAGQEGDYLGFETLTFAPLDKALVEVSLLTPEEREWWNAYHADVRRILAPQLDGEAGFAELFFTDVFVPDSDVLGAVGAGWSVAMSTAGNERGLSLRSPGRFCAAADRLVDLYRASGQPTRRQASRARSGARSAMPESASPGVLGTCERNIEPNLPAPMRAARTGRPASTRRCSRP